MAEETQVIEPVIIGNATLYLADCRDILPTLSGVDAVVVDMPYGVMLGEMDNGQAREKNQQPYSTFSDTPEYLKSVMIPALKLALRKAKRGLVFPGTRHFWLYPQSDEMSCWFIPASCSRGKWGYNNAQPILYYGVSPRAGKGEDGAGISLQATSPDIEHPCPKPEKLMMWAVNKASLPGETVLDFAMGSGTTGVACARLGRKFIGIECEPKYFKIAVERIKREYDQLKMF